MHICHSSAPITHVPGASPQVSLREDAKSVNLQPQGNTNSPYLFCSSWIHQQPQHQLRSMHLFPSVPKTVRLLKQNFQLRKITVGFQLLVSGKGLAMLGLEQGGCSQPQEPLQDPASQSPAVEGPRADNLPPWPLHQRNSF